MDLRRRDPRHRPLPRASRIGSPAATSPAATSSCPASIASCSRSSRTRSPFASNARRPRAPSCDTRRAGHGRGSRTGIARRRSPSSPSVTSSVSIPATSGAGCRSLGTIERDPACSVSRQPTVGPARSTRSGELPTTMRSARSTRFHAQTTRRPRRRPSPVRPGREARKRRPARPEPFGRSLASTRRRYGSTATSSVASHHEISAAIAHRG